MLVLSRRQDEEIHIPEYGIVIRVLQTSTRRVRLGITAGRNVQITRPDAKKSPQATRTIRRLAADCRQGD